MFPSAIRRQLGGLVPPKIAAPSILSTSGGPDVSHLVSFYGKLPKGPAPSSSRSGIKARFFEGKNASGGPLVAIILGVFVLSYTIDYNMHLKHHKNHAH